MIEKQQNIKPLEGNQIEMGELFRNSFLNNNEVIYFFTDKRFMVLDKESLEITSQMRFHEFQPNIKDCEFTVRGYCGNGFIIAFNLSGESPIDRYN